MKAVLKKLARPLMGVLLVCAATCTWAAESQLLPGNLLSPTSVQETRPDAYKKAPPWRVGVSFAGVGNSWIVQMIQEMRYEASLHKEIGEFLFTEANWKPAKQVSDVQDLLTKKIDLLIIGPISEAVGAPLIADAAKRGIPVVTFGAYGNGTQSTTEIMGGGKVFGRQGGQFLCSELKGKGRIWAFRGMAGVDEEQLRYDGFRKAVDACGLKVTNEVFGDWSYVKGKQLCENLVLSGQPVDGIWFSGAEMTRACIDVFKETGKALVPMTGEANNGFLRVWKSSGVKSVAPIFTPGLGAATVRAAVALLRGQSVHRSYFSAPEPITGATLDQYFRPDLNDAYWFPTTLPEATLMKMFHR
ncbi:ABC transporter substrate-binding protein [Ralstonia soli]|uniref:ABC transporter substrate-binding protein n=1 Tax=Ralstonia soli TaxID=2953896 RepID=A0ABT1AMP0_9RALS|nr:ABC transporter substrate-binding protein [Ralstonia soli]MCO5399695.1 ABC transporter substrate-binding protein [Ralstonia soli]